MAAIGGILLIGGIVLVAKMATRRSKPQTADRDSSDDGMNP